MGPSTIGKRYQPWAGGESAGIAYYRGRKNFGRLEQRLHDRLASLPRPDAALTIPLPLPVNQPRTERSRFLPLAGTAAAGSPAYNFDVKYPQEYALAMSTAIQSSHPPEAGVKAYKSLDNSVLLERIPAVRREWVRACSSWAITISRMK